ncbi:MAG TPA: hypothetical protein VN818_08305 [Gammaproteobacteria bacterium]|nr:hypothetical protein [Gammaproteobacteria bacterium]
MSNRLDPRARLFVLFACATAWFIAPPASATPISLDFNDFYADPSVTVASDGTAALIAEDAGLSFVLLANDPFFGDPQIIVPGLATQLLFDYVFAEADGQDDQFRAFVLDSETGLAPPGFEFLTAQSGSGTVAFDLSGLVGRTLGLQFELAALFADTGVGSIVALSGLRLEVQDPVSVREPDTVALLGAAFLVWLLAFRGRRLVRG